MESTISYADPASVDALNRLSTAYSELPASYFAFLASSNGAEGELGITPGWCVVWPAEEALVATDEYGLPEFLPGYFAFGGNGGGELFVIRVDKGAEDPVVYMVPAIGMAQDTLVPIASAFEVFREAMGQILPGGA